jgi:hypothetical protein
MPGELQRAIGELQSSFRRLGAVSRRYSAWSGIRAELDRPSYAVAIQRQDWDELANRSRSRRSAYERTANQLLALRRSLQSEYIVNGDAAAVYDEWYVPPRSRPDWAQLRGGVEAELRGRGRSRRQIGQAILQLQQLDEDTTVRIHRQRILDTESDLDQFYRRCLAGWIGAELAFRVAELNQHFRRGRRPRTDADTFVTDTSAYVEATERSYFEQLRSGFIPSPDFPARGEALDRLGAAIRYAAAAARTRAVSQTASWEAGPSALAVANSLRSLLRHVALRGQLRWAAADVEASSSREWLRAAATRGFETAWQWPRLHTIASLADRRNRVPDGTQVSVQGILGQVQITHVADVPVTNALVRDLQGNEIAITTKHRKADSGGMVEGCYVRVSGNWSRRDPRLQRPAVELMRHRLTELSGTSWTDWVTLRLRGIYEASPEALSVEWTWQPGTDGAGNQLRYKQWFAEERRPT